MRLKNSGKFPNLREDSYLLFTSTNNFGRLSISLTNVGLRRSRLLLFGAKVTRSKSAGCQRLMCFTILFEHFPQTGHRLRTA